MKAIFNNVSELLCSPLDNNETILLDNFVTQSEGSLVADKSVNDPTKALIMIATPKVLDIGDDLNGKTIYMNFPDITPNNLVSHELAVLSGGSKILVEVLADRVVVQTAPIQGPAMILYYYDITNNAVTVNMQILKYNLLEGMKVVSVDKTSAFYNCFTIR